MKNFLAKNKKVLDIVLGVIGALVLIVAVATALSTIGLPTFKLYVVNSGSMAPAIHAGSVAVVKTDQNSINNIKEGDVVTFRKPVGEGDTITHRVASVVEGSYQTKGDANPSNDGWTVPKSQIIGREVFAMPLLGYPVAFAKTPIGFFLIILIPAMFIIISEALTLKRELSRPSKKKTHLGSFGNKTKILTVVLLMPFVGLLLVSNTFALFSDQERIEENQISAGTWPERHLVINEVYYDVGASCGNEGDNPNPDEWVELYNPSGSSVDLKNWTLTDNSSATIIHSASKIIPAGGFAIISKDAKTWTPVVGCWNPPASAVIIVTGQKIGNDLANSGDRLVLKDNTGAPIDAVSWGTDTSQLNPSVPTVADGHSIERSPLGTDTNTAADWSDNSTPSPGTP